MNGATKNSSNSGFTLLEMLVVLALLSLLMVVLTSTIYLGITARARVTSVAMDQQDFSNFRRILTEKLGLAYPEWVGTGKSGRIEFSGTPNHLAFLGPALGMQGPGFSFYDISLVKNNGKQEILLQTTYDEAVPGPTQSTYFAAGLASLKLQYFGSPGDGGAALWQNDWVMRSTTPDLVTVAVTFPKGDRRSWPVLTIHPAIDGDITCEIDTSTHRCAGR